MKRTFNLTIAAFFILSGFVVSSNTSLADRAANVSGQIEYKKKGAQFVVYLEGEGEASAVSDTVVVDQINKMYSPHVTTVPKGTTINFKNSDPFLHNVYCIDDRKGKGIFNHAITHFNKRGTFYTFDEPGLYILLCNVHPEMEAFILVTDTPYAAVTDAETGSYSIPNVPPGQYRLKIWQSKLKKKKLKRFEQDVTVGRGQELTVNFTF